jgi:hypothetical protein
VLSWREGRGLGSRPVGARGVAAWFTAEGGRRWEKKKEKEKGEKGKEEKKKEKRKKENKGRKIEKGFRKLGEFLGKLGEGFCGFFWVSQIPALIPGRR